MPVTARFVMICCAQMIHDLKEAAEISMGTEITMVDIISIKALADQVRTVHTYHYEAILVNRQKQC